MAVLLNLSKVQFLKDCTYEQLLEAQRLIDSGIQIGLLYFWYNMKNMHFWPAFNDVSMRAEVVTNIFRYPEWEIHILRWFAEYEENIKHLNR